jgi:hypothetical protein
LIVIGYAFIFYLFSDATKEKRVSKRPKLSQEREKRFNNATEAVQKGTAMHTASKNFNVPHSMLHRIVQCDGIYKFTFNCAVNQVFSEEEEKELVKYLQTATRMHYGPSQHDIMHLAHDYAVANRMKIPDSWQKNEAAGKQWCYNFMRRNNKLSLRKPEATSLSQATSFNRYNVPLFLKKLSGILEKHKFTPDKIYNLDETANTTAHTPGTAVACKGIKQVGSVTSGKRGPKLHS